MKKGLVKIFRLSDKAKKLTAVVLIVFSCLRLCSVCVYVVCKRKQA